MIEVHFQLTSITRRREKKYQQWFFKCTEIRERLQAVYGTYALWNKAIKKWAGQFYVTWDSIEDEECEEQLCFQCSTLTMCKKWNEWLKLTAK